MPNNSEQALHTLRNYALLYGRARSPLVCYFISQRAKSLRFQAVIMHQCRIWW